MSSDIYTDWVKDTKKAKTRVEKLADRCYSWRGHMTGECVGLNCYAEFDTRTAALEAATGFMHRLGYKVDRP